MEISLDTETTGLDLNHGCKPYMVIAADNTGTTYSWEWDVDPLTRQPFIPKNDKKEISTLLNDAIVVYMHNALYDIKALANIDIIAPISKIRDTMLMSHALNSGGVHGLKDLALKFLLIDDTDEEEMQKIVVKARRLAKKLEWNIAVKNHPELPSTHGSIKHIWKYDTWLPRQIAKYFHYEEESPFWNVSSKYGDQDAVRTLLLAYEFEKLLQQDDKIWAGFLFNNKCLEPLYKIQENGIPLKEEKAQAIRNSLDKQQTNMYFKAKASVVVPPDERLTQPKTLHNVLFTQLKCEPTMFTTTGNPSATADVMLDFAQIAEEEGNQQQLKFLIPFLINKKCQKSKDSLTQYQTLAINGRLYPNYQPTGTATTRLSSQNPNGQNITKTKNPFEGKLNHPLLSKVNMNLRRLFGPTHPNVWISADYSQLQLRIFAYKSGETSLKEAFEHGWDFHNYMAHRIFKLKEEIKPTSHQRRIAKNVNFGFIFGAKPRKIERTAGMPGLWSDLMKMFPNAQAFLKKTSKEVKQTGFVTLEGVMIKPDGRKTPMKYKLSCPQPHKAVNYIVQGFEGLIVKQAMCRLHHDIEGRFWQHYLFPDNDPDSKFCNMIMNVHDELNFEFDSLDTARVCSNQIKYQMENAGTLFDVETPVDLELITDSWDTSEDFPMLSTEEESRLIPF